LFHFGAKKIHVLYLETEGEFANLASGDAPIRNYTVNCHGYTMGYLSIRWHLSFLVNICIDHPTPKTPEGMSFFIGSRSICQKDIDKDLMYRKLDLQFFEVCSARYWDKRSLHNTMTTWTWIFILIMLIDLLRAVQACEVGGTSPMECASSRRNRYFCRPAEHRGTLGRPELALKARSIISHLHITWALLES
jgi:hypothetical protein